jgi:hypothetical protein
MNSKEVTKEKTKFSHFSAIINLFGLVIILALWWWLFPSEAFRIILGFLLLIIIVSYVVQLFFSIFKIASIAKVVDFNGYAYGGMTFLKIGEETSRFFGLLRKYTIKNKDVVCIIKTKFLFLNKYEIYFYKEKSLSYVKATTLFWVLEKKFPVDKVFILPGLFSSFWVSYFKSGLLGVILVKKLLNSVKSVQQLYFEEILINSKEEKILTKELYLTGGGNICDFRYAKSAVWEINQKGYFGVDPAQFLKLGFYSYTSSPFVKIGLLPEELLFSFTGITFKIPWGNLKEVVVRKALIGNSWAFIHDCENAPRGIVFFTAGGDNQEVLKQIMQHVKVTQVK